MQTINVKELAQLKNGGEIELFDVRTPVEFREFHAMGAKNLPLDSVAFKRWLIERERSNDTSLPVYLICKSGSRSAQAYKQCAEVGIDGACSVVGGTSAWEQAGLPVQRGKKAISLERQVRIAAGTLALLGAVLGFFVNPYFIGLSGFVGAGLIFAGLTDTCGMGMMLAKMPWNQTTPSCSA